MKRPFIAFVIVGVLGAFARPVEAQGFWRWLEELSGPKVHGLGFELSGLCWGTDVDSGARSWQPNPYCLDTRPDEPLVMVGIEFYMLVGDNSLTDDPNDRVDALGFLPTVDVQLARGLAAGGGLGVRRYATPAGTFNKPDAEAWVRIRPIALVAQSERRSAGHDWLEFRLGVVFHPSYAEGLFGPGSRRLESGPSFFLGTQINLLNVSR
jgi:hypothetical protein